MLLIWRVYTYFKSFLGHNSFRGGDRRCPQIFTVNSALCICLSSYLFFWTKEVCEKVWYCSLGGRGSVSLCVRLCSCENYSQSGKEINNTKIMEDKRSIILNINKVLSSVKTGGHHVWPLPDIKCLWMIYHAWVLPANLSTTI